MSETFTKMDEEKIRSDVIEGCAEILAQKFFCEECPIRCRKCEFEKCKDKWFEYLNEQIVK